MRMRRLGLIVAVLMAVLAAPAGASAYLPPGFIGISPQNTLGHKDFELMGEAGVDNARLPLYWTVVEGTSPLVVAPDWSGFDKEVELAAEDDVRIMPFVWGSPEWVAGEPSQLPVKTSWQRWACRSSSAKPPSATGPKANSGKNTRSSPSCRSPTGRSGTRRTSSAR